MITNDRIAAAAAKLTDLPPLNDLQLLGVGGLLHSVDRSELRDAIALRLLSLAGWPPPYCPVADPASTAALARSVQRMELDHPLLLALAGLPDDQVALWCSETFWTKAGQLTTSRRLDATRDALLTEVLVAAVPGDIAREAVSVG